MFRVIGMCHHTYLNFLLNFLFYDLSILLQGICYAEIFICVSKFVGQSILIMALFVELIAKLSKSTSERANTSVTRAVVKEEGNMQVC